MRQNHLIDKFQRGVIRWYNRVGRAFYWRTHILNDWQWLFLEVLLRKTKAEAVEKMFPSLIAKYYEPRIVLEVTGSELESDLRCLGLYRQRREGLKLISAKIVSEHKGVVPTDPHSLNSLPGVGPYITNAILCFCHGQRRPVVDINVARVLTRFMGLNTPKNATATCLWELAERMLPKRNWKEYNYGLLDLGALLCKGKNPRCPSCFLGNICRFAQKRSRVHD